MVCDSCYLLSKLGVFMYDAFNVVCKDGKICSCEGRHESFELFDFNGSGLGKYTHRKI